MRKVVFLLLSTIISCKTMNNKLGNYTEDTFEFFVVNNDKFEHYMQQIDKLNSDKNIGFCLSLIDSLLSEFNNSQEPYLDTSSLFYKYLESTTIIGIQKEISLSEMRLKELKNSVIKRQEVDTDHPEFIFFLKCLLKYYTLPYSENSIIWSINIPISFKSGLLECADSIIYRNLLTNNYRINSGYQKEQFSPINMLGAFTRTDEEYYLFPREICSRLHYGLVSNHCENRWGIEGVLLRQIFVDEFEGKVNLIICPHD